MGLRVVNITPNSSADRLREDLEKKASARGKPMRSFVGAIYVFAVKNRQLFSGPLQEPRTKPGKHIGATVPESVFRELGSWAKSEQTTRARWCCYILEKALQPKMMARIFGDDDH